MKLSEVISKLGEKGLHKTAENLKRIVAVENGNKIAWLDTIKYADAQVTYFMKYLQKNKKFFSGREIDKLAGIVRETGKLLEIDMDKGKPVNKKLGKVNLSATKAERAWVDFLLRFGGLLGEAVQLRRLLKRSEQAIQRFK